MATLFEAYVTNAGKYSEGQLVGETLKFPTTAQEVEALLKRIGVDGVRYQEIFITSFDGDVLGLYDHLSEYEIWTSLIIWPACFPILPHRSWKHWRPSSTVAITVLRCGTSSI